MDRFVTRKTKQGESVPSTSNSSTGCEQTKTARNPAKSERSKQKIVNRKFSADWENSFFVTESNGKTLCLICRFTFSDNKKYAVERHFTSNHGEVNTKFLAPDKRASEIARLKNELHSQKNIVRKFLDKNELLTFASYEIAFDMAKAAKPYSDGEFYKKLMRKTVSTLCENVDEKVKIILVDNIDSLALSDQTISRRVNDIGTEIETRLKNDLKNCKAFAIALDESTDIGDVSQLVIWVRYIIDMDRCEENILALVPLHEQTRAVDVFDAFRQVQLRFNLDLKKLVCVCTDGAPTMIGKHKGFVARLKKFISDNNDEIDHELISYHCIIHQQNLCAAAVGDESTVLTTITKIINTIRSSSLRHRRFKLLMEELDAKFQDIMYFSSVRWLSCGMVLNRFSDLLQEIKQFLMEQKLEKELKEISTPTWQNELYFLCDITNHLNELNLKLQGRDKFVWDLAKTVMDFRLKLTSFKCQIQENDFTFFPTLKENQNARNYNTSRFVNFINILIEQFESRFSDFQKYNLAFKFLKNPFDFDSMKVEELSVLFGTKKTHLEFDISLIEQETHLKAASSIERWKRLISDCSFIVLNDIVPSFVCMFGSTYVCECTFSSLVRRKTKYCNALSQHSLKSEIRCELCNFEPDFRKIV